MRGFLRKLCKKLLQISFAFSFDSVNPPARPDSVERTPETRAIIRKPKRTRSKRPTTRPPTLSPLPPLRLQTPRKASLPVALFSTKNKDNEDYTHERDLAFSTEGQISLASTSHGKLFVIKTIRASTIRGPVKYPKEARNLQNLSVKHGNIIDLFACEWAYGPHGGLVWRQKMQYCALGDLFDVQSRFYERGRLVPELFIVHVISSLQEALGFLHCGLIPDAPQDKESPDVRYRQLDSYTPLIHADIKLENIFLDLADIDHEVLRREDSGGQSSSSSKLGNRSSALYGCPIVKLADFGLSTRSGDPKSGPCGTPGFSAPEIVFSDPWRDMEMTFASDIYSLGATIHALALMELPEYKPDRAPRLNRSVYQHEDIDDYIIWCLQHEPDKRPTATQLIEVGGGFFRGLRYKIWSDYQSRGENPIPTWAFGDSNDSDDCQTVSEHVVSKSNSIGPLPSFTSRTSYHLSPLRPGDSVGSWLGPRSARAEFDDPSSPDQYSGPDSFFDDASSIYSQSGEGESADFWRIDSEPENHRVPSNKASNSDILAASRVLAVSAAPDNGTDTFSNDESSIYSQTSDEEFGYLRRSVSEPRARAERENEADKSEILAVSRLSASQAPSSGPDSFFDDSSSTYSQNSDEEFAYLRRSDDATRVRKGPGGLAGVEAGADLEYSEEFPGFYDGR